MDSSQKGADYRLSSLPEISRKETKGMSPLGIRINVKNRFLERVKLVNFSQTNKKKRKG
jgi:hypothetical protein